MRDKLLIKTAFACMACDGEIDAKEISCIQKVFEEIDCVFAESLSSTLNEFREQLNADNMVFFNSLFVELSNSVLSESEELELICIAIKIIEADNVIDYNEVRLLKKIRSYLKISDKALLDAMPDKEDYIASDVVNNLDFFDGFNWDININGIDLLQH